VPPSASSNQRKGSSDFVDYITLKKETVRYPEKSVTNRVNQTENLKE
jgi:hypothetical protein